jgi:peptide/nickel transport system permease protein
MPTLPLIVLGGMVFLAVAAPVVAPHDPVHSSLRDSMLPPFWVDGGSTEHILGTDNLGRDVLSRLIYGARISLSVAALSLLIATLIGTAVGLTAGYLGGWVDFYLMRLVDMVLSLPTLLIALALAIAVGPSFTNLVLVIGFLLWVRIARLVRGETLLIKEYDYVRYSRAIGVPPLWILARHVLPNVMPTLLVAMTLEVGDVILIEAGLSFLGAGVPPPAPSWGIMISDGRALLATGWWIALFAGLAVTLAVLSTNSLGDWLRDRIDPTMRV